jgi:hypothetical protein
MRGETLVTAVEVERLTTDDELDDAKPSISRHLVYMWRGMGLLEPQGKRGRSPLYRWGDICDVERRMAKRAWSANNHRARRVA